MKALSSLIRRLREDPDFREEVRRIILTDELLDLPRRVDENFSRAFQLIHSLAKAISDLTTAVERLRAEMHKEFRRVWKAIETLTQRVNDLTQQVAALTEAQKRTEDQLSTLTRQVGRLTVDVDELKGMNLEAEWVRKAPAILGRYFRRFRVWSKGDLWDLLHDAVDRGLLESNEADEVAWADVVAEGRTKEGQDRRAVVEVSWTVGREDIERVRRRADALARLGVPTVAVAAGREVPEDVRRLARELGVWVIEDGIRVVGPEE